MTGDPVRLEMLRALCRRSAVVRVSHVTAALLHDLPVPWRFAETDLLHLTGRSNSHYSALDPRVTLHRRAEIPDCLYRRHGIPVSSPSQLFVECARYLSVPELVILGDQLVRIPRSGLEARDSAWTTVGDLERSLRQARGRLGVVVAREALGQVRVGADSPPETRLRMAILGAGLPEPELQIRLEPRDPFSPVGDAGYRRERIVLQYEGEYHFSAEQQARDQRRNAQFELQGWTVVLVNRVDLRENFYGTVKRVRALLRRHQAQDRVSEL